MGRRSSYCSQWTPWWPPPLGRTSQSKDEAPVQLLALSGLPGVGRDLAVSVVDVLGVPGDDESGSLDSCCADVR